MDEYNERKKKWFLDVRNTPCAREALIYGLLSGMLVGAVNFARTSVIKRSCDWGVGSFVLVSFAAW
jgi:cytochrome c oxidase assembly protein subunit 20